MREWLTVIVVLLILGIVLDGWRRVRNARRDSLKMSPKLRQSEWDEAFRQDYRSEFPNGGARVVGTAQPETRAEPSFGESEFEAAPASESDAHISQAPGQEQAHQPEAAEPDTEPNETGAAAPEERIESNSRTESIPQQVALNLDESVPMLMESVEHETSAEGAQTHAAQPKTQRRHNRQTAASTPSADTASTQQQGPGPEAPEPEEVLIINVMAPKGRYFQGDELQQIIFDQGMRYGSMSIFHRYRDPQGLGPVQFSLANMVKPGTFDLDTMASFQTPGVSLFLTLPLEGDSVAAFDLMLDTAKVLAERLGGELKDENRSDMTRQTMEHDRQRVLDFVRKQLSRGTV